MSRLFDGVDDQIQTALGNCDIDAGPSSIVAIIRRGADGSWDQVLGTHDSGGSGFHLRLELTDGNVFEYGASGGLPTSPFTVLTAENWLLIAGTKATGTVTPRGHKYVYDTDTWTHSDFGAATGDGSAPGAGGTVRFGSWQNDDYLTGDFLVAGMWDRQLGDDEIETLAFTLQSWYASNPVGLWLLDQGAVTQNLSDLTGGGADQSSIVGTAVSTNHPPLFNRYGEVMYVRAQVTPAAITAAEIAGARQMSLPALIPEAPPEVVAY